MEAHLHRLRAFLHSSGGLNADAANHAMAWESLWRSSAPAKFLLRLYGEKSINFLSTLDFAHWLVRNACRKARGPQKSGQRSESWGGSGLLLVLCDTLKGQTMRLHERACQTQKTFRLLLQNPVRRDGKKRNAKNFVPLWP